MPDRSTTEGGIFNIVVQFSFPPFFKQVMVKTSYTFCQGYLPKLDLQIDRGTEFTAWRTQWNCYSSLSGLVNEDVTKQVKALTLCLSSHQAGTRGNGCSANNPARKNKGKEFVQVVGEHGIKGDINNAQHITAHCHKGVTLPRCAVVRQHNRGQHRHQPRLSMWIHNKTARSKYGCTQ